MTEEKARIRVKVGQIEIEYEGDPAFLKTDFIETMKEVVELREKHPTAGLASPTAPSVVPVIGNTTLTTDTIATILKAEKGADLVMSAAARLHFAMAKLQFTRQEIIDEMRTAPGYFKESYVANLSNYLNTLTKADRLRLTGTDTYSISVKEKAALEAKIALA